MMTIDMKSSSVGVLPLTGHGDATTARRLPRFVARSVIGWMQRVIEIRASRLALLEMSDDQLKDIGLSRADAYYEGNRTIWDRSR